MAGMERKREDSQGQRYALAPEFTHLSITKSHSLLRIKVVKNETVPICCGELECFPLD